MAKFQRHTIQGSGRVIFVSYKMSWGKMYYSFDGEETWTTNFENGFQEAKEKNKLIFAEEK